MFTEYLEAYNASIGRFNAIGTRGPLTAVQRAQACRLELKTTLRICRQLIAATRDDAELQPLYQAQLRCLKRMHYGFVMLEACAIEKARRNN
jgi:hypothetical protein